MGVSAPRPPPTPATSGCVCDIRPLATPVGACDFRPAPATPASAYTCAFRLPGDFRPPCPAAAMARAGSLPAWPGYWWMSSDCSASSPNGWLVMNWRVSV
ncbi:hypothetical protein GCM10009741_31280 [Kribbella lupini]|uniref:Uncharacterized protein n=1 Tax=Kribbella lupini TaxID=291602 RepID=A0ABN2AU39_9ACTN